MSFLKDYGPAIAAAAAAAMSGGTSLAATPGILAGAAEGALAAGGTSLAVGNNSDKALGDVAMGGVSGGIGGASKVVPAPAPGAMPVAVPTPAPGAMPGAIPAPSAVNAVPGVTDAPVQNIAEQGLGSVGDQSLQQTPDLAWRQGSPQLEHNGIASAPPAGSISPDDGAAMLENTIPPTGGISPEDGAVMLENSVPPTEPGMDDWINDNQGKALLGLGATSMGVDAYETRKQEKARKKAKEDGEADWRGRLDYYGGQDGPVNSMTDYERRNG